MLSESEHQAPDESGSESGSEPEPAPTGLPLTQVLGVGGLSVFVAVVLALHGLRRDLNPAEDTISEYSLGSYGWLMRAAFVALGLGVLATAVSLRPRFGRSPWWQAGLVLLAFTAIGLFLDAGYNTDHPRVIETADGTVHGVGMLIVCLTLPAATLAVGWELARNALVPAQGRRLQCLAGAQLVGVLAFETSPPAYRGLAERMAIIVAVTTLALLQSVTRSLHDRSAGRRRIPGPG